MASIDEGSERLGVWQELMGQDIQLKVIEEGSPDARSCDAGDAVCVDFVGRPVEGRDDVAGTGTAGEGGTGQVFQSVQKWWVVIGDKDVVPALEMGLRFMKEGETALVYGNSKFVYGPAERINPDSKYSLSPNSNCVYRVKVHKLVHEEKEFQAANMQLDINTSKKRIANDVFINEWSGDFGRTKALLIYKKASDNLTHVMTDETLDEEVRKQAQALWIDCINNMAAVHLRAGEYGKAKEAATQVLMKDPDNLKALLRAARGALYDPAGTFEETEAAVEAAESVSNGDDKDVKRLRIELERKKREYKNKSKAMLSKMSEAIGGKKEAPNDESRATRSSNKPKKAPNQSKSVDDKTQLPKTATKEPSMTWLSVFLQVCLPLCACLAYLAVSKFLTTPQILSD